MVSDFELILIENRQQGGNRLTKVIKRDCTEVDFQKEKITNAIFKVDKSGILLPKSASETLIFQGFQPSHFYKCAHFFKMLRNSSTGSS